jgi:hypothetical protein
MRQRYASYFAWMIAGLTVLLSAIFAWLQNR